MKYTDPHLPKDFDHSDIEQSFYRPSVYKQEIEMSESSELSDKPSRMELDSVASIHRIKQMSFSRISINRGLQNASFWTAPNRITVAYGSENGEGKFRHLSMVSELNQSEVRRKFTVQTEIKKPIENE